MRLKALQLGARQSLIEVLIKGVAEQSLKLSACHAGLVCSRHYITCL